MINSNSFYNNIFINNPELSLDALIADLSKFIEVPYWNTVDFNENRKNQHNFLKRLLSSLNDFDQQVSTESRKVKSSFVPISKEYLDYYKYLEQKLTIIINQYNASAYRTPIAKDFPSINSFLESVQSLLIGFNFHTNDIKPSEDNSYNQPATEPIISPNDIRNID